MTFTARAARDSANPPPGVSVVSVLLVLTRWVCGGVGVGVGVGVSVCVGL